MKEIFDIKYSCTGNPELKTMNIDWLAVRESGAPPKRAL